MARYSNCEPASLSVNLYGKIRSLSADKRSILSLIGGTTIAQALNFAFSPVQTRLFSPEVFGELSVFTSITSIVGVIACLRYELAIVLPRDDDEGFALLRLTYLFAFVVSAVGTLGLLVGRDSIYALLGAPGLARYWPYVPVTILLGGIIQSSNYWLTRTRQFTMLSYNKVIPVLVINLASIGLGLAGGRGIHARLVSILLGNVANIAVLALAIMPEFKHATSRTSYARKTLFGTYRNFLVFDIWGAFINTVSWMVVPLLMNYYYGAAAAGQYSIGLRVIQIPASIIGSSITQVFLKTANERRLSGTLELYTKKALRQLFMLTTPFAILLAIFGKGIFTVVFGAEWGAAGAYTQILAPWAVVWFVSSPISSVYTIAQKQNLSLLTSTLNLVTRFLSLYIGSLFKDEYLGIAIFSATGILTNGLSVFLCLGIARRSDRAMAAVKD